MTEETQETVEPTSLDQIMSASEKAEPAQQGTPDKQETPTGAKETAESPSADAKDTAKADKAEADKAEADTDAEKGERARDEKGRFVPKEEADGLRKALREERQKRQRLEQQRKEPDEEKDVWADPKGFIKDELAKQRAEQDQRFFALSETHAKSRHEDYDEVVAELIEDAETDPTIAREIYPQVSSHIDPAEFLYQQAKQRKELKSFDGDLGKYRESIETPLKTEVQTLQEKIAGLEKQLKGLGKVTSSLNDEQSTSGKQVSDEAANEPTPMTDILKPKRRA